MEHNAVKAVKEFFESVNSLLGLSVKCEIQVLERGKFPICRRNGCLAVVPLFFEHPDLKDNVRKVLMSELYSCYYLDKEKSGRLDINPGFMAKGICQAMGISFLSDDEIEYDLRNIRRMLFDDTENGCYFAVGQKLRESAFVSYEVVDIVRDGEEETLVTVRPIGHNLGKSERIMTEEELYQRCCNYRNLKDEKVDMRRNLVVISGPSGVGKDTIVKELLARYPNINKTVSVTTRTKRSNETDGVDYYFVTKEQFYEYQMNGSLVEYELYDGNYYGTLYEEVERYTENEPLILVIDIRGRRSVMMRYPMAKAVFIAPPSFEVLKARITSRKENSPAEIEHRLTVATDEIEQATKYDYVVTNEDVEICVRQLADIVNQKV